MRISVTCHGFLDMTAVLLLHRHHFVRIGEAAHPCLQTPSIGFFILISLGLVDDHPFSCIIPFHIRQWKGIC